ncbi:MAG TPA: hypothetical protein VFB76_09015 [Candidatus Angelobacter sp.]|nr:hypothetical protein [Candidatus Angelobacter sp.]
MSKPLIFISCGQYTDAEKSLGKAIVKAVESVTEMDAFFAEEFQDLNGLDSNILNALRDCVAFITVMHPRGKIIRPDGSTHTRASVWIEQEIAIATYIQRVEKRTLPVIAFIHESVGREGIRDLLHINPITFRHEEEVLNALRQRLQEWKGLQPSGIHVQIMATPLRVQDQHQIRQLVVSLVNNSNQRIISLNCMVRLPAGILKHWSSSYPTETKSDDHRYRCFSFDEKNTGPIAPRSIGHLITFEYCRQCAIDNFGDVDWISAQAITEMVVEGTAWIENREYKTTVTMRDLSIDSLSTAAR